MLPYASGAPAIPARSRRADGTRLTMRILALGGRHCHMLAGAASGVQADFFWTDGDASARRQHGDVTALRPRHLPLLRRTLRRGEYDVVLCEAIRHPLVRRGSFWPADVARAGLRLRREPEVLGPRLLRWLLRDVSTPLAIICRSDDPIISRPNHPLLMGCRLYFKRELPVNRFKVFQHSTRKLVTLNGILRRPPLLQLCAKLRPLSLGLPLGDWLEREVPPEREIDVFYAGTDIPWGARDRSHIAELRELGRMGFRVDIAEERLPRDVFLDRCARSWLTWSPEGLGWECWRHYEAAALGSVPLCNHPGIVRHAPLLAGQHAVFYDDAPGELLAAARQALADTTRLQRMAAEARRHVLAHHTQEQLLRHLLRATLEVRHDESRPAHR